MISMYSLMVGVFLAPLLVGMRPRAKKENLTSDEDPVMLFPFDNSRYSNIEKAGQGTFGTVYRAKDSVTNQLVAIKVMKDNSNSEDLQRQCNKIKSLHERVTEVLQGADVHLMKCIESQGQYVIYEWAGEEGSKMLPTLSFDAARALLKQVIMALHALSGSRTTILHHDLKWQNVAVNSGCLKLIDLDDWIFGEWGKRSDITAHTPLFSPPEILTEGRRKNYFCGLTEARARATARATATASARAGKFDTATVACPGAYSFDMYTAGMMALQICGFEWVFFAQFMHFGRRTNEEKQNLQRELKSYARMTPVYESIPLYGILRLKMYLLEGNRLRALLDLDPDIGQEVENFKEETMCNSLASVTYKLTHGCIQAEFQRDDAILMSHAALAKEKFVSCKAKLTGEAIDAMESMLHSKPSQRPDPSKLLNSKLFTGVATKCANDDAVGSFEESERAMTEEDEEEGYQNVIVELKDQIAASNQAVYADSMNEDIEVNMNAANQTSSNHQEQVHIEDNMNAANQEERVNETVQVHPAADKVVEQSQEQQFREQFRERDCGPCRATPIEKVLNSGKVVPRKNQMGQILAWCWVGYNPGNNPPIGCKWMGKFVNNKYGLQCTCQS